MAEEEVRITLRLPAALRDQLLEAGESKSRSMNGEIVERIRWTFGPLSQDFEDLVRQVNERNDEIAQLKRRLEAQQEAYAQLKEVFDIHRHVVDSYKSLVERTEAHSERIADLVEKVATVALDDETPATERELSLVKQVMEVAHQMQRSNKESQLRKRYADEILEE